MTLASIMKLALRQLDEAAEDMSEYDELFKSYANMGYMIALRLFLKPREVLEIRTDSRGCAELDGLFIARVVEVRDEQDRSVRFVMDGDGHTLHTGAAEQTVSVLAEIECPPMTDGMDEPMLPEFAHPALADYICYRHLSSGNLAKQSRAEFFRQSFYQQMRAMTPQGAGSVTRMKNLYMVTDVRYRH